MIDLIIDEDSYTGEDTVIINGEKAIRIDDPSKSPTAESGGMRDVYMTSKYVYKKGYVGQEADLIPSQRDRKYFAQVVLVDIHRNWVVQKRVDCVPNFATESQWKLIEKIADKYDISDVSWTSDTWGNKVNRNTHNWIVNKRGIPVIFDYAD
jgi:hypothetical protein